MVEAIQRGDKKKTTPGSKVLEVDPVFGLVERLHFFFFLLSANQFPSGHNYSQLHFIIVHLLSSFLSRRREIGQKHKELFPGFGLWKSRLVLFTQSLFRFTQPNHRHVTCQAQVNRGKQIVLINQWLLSNQRIPERYTR